MRRLLVITGMLFFAVLIVDTASRLQDQFEAGTLFDRYNSQRKADITLFTVSICGLATLGFLEFVRPKWMAKREAASPLPLSRQPVAKATHHTTAPTNIYEAPKAMDEWEERQPQLSVAHRRLSVDMTGVWMAFLRIYCGVLPVVYLYTFLNYVFLWLPSGAGNIFLSFIFPMLLLISVMASVGILKKRAWGAKFGYAIAIFHLLIFPFGTAAGFVMLIALVSTISEFSDPKRKRTQGT